MKLKYNSKMYLSCINKWQFAMFDIQILKILQIWSNDLLKLNFLRENGSFFSADNIGRFHRSYHRYIGIGHTLISRHFHLPYKGQLIHGKFTLVKRETKQRRP